MKRDLDRLMAERNLDAIVVEGPDGLGSANPDFNYFVGGAHLNGLVIKKRGEPTLLIHGPWEQLQAEATGLRLIPNTRWNIREIQEQLPDRFQAQVEYRRRIFTDLGISGRVGVYGTVAAGPSFALLTALAQKLPGLEVVGEFEKDIIAMARLTKEPEEVERMREVGRRTCAVMQAVVAWLRTGQPGPGDTLVTRIGEPMTIGQAKELIRRELALQGLEAPEGVIFAQGRDAGLPHATGDESAALKLGQAIVFDIFPREPGGYYHDMTRTFAVGHAPPELQQAYDDTLAAFEQVVSNLKAGEPTKPYQDMVCQFFEERGHETIGSKYPIEEGYIHSLGHGLGLEVHEDFGFPSHKDRGDRLTPGAVFTIEPGLYYPSKGYGVRIEDTYYCTPDGQFESLTPFPKDLIIPLA